MPDDSPAPEFQAEAQQMVEQIEAMLAATEKGQGETVRITLTIPKEHAILAAWLQFKADTKAAGELALLPRPLRLHFEDGGRTRHWERARDYFARTIFERFDDDWTTLLLSGHPPLPASRAETAPPAPAGRFWWPEEAIDDDIPF